MKKILFLTFTILSLSLNAKSANISKLKDKISRQSAEVSKIGAQIKSLEKKLGKTNETYMDKTRLLKSLDQKIVQLRNDLSASALDISTSFKSSKKILNHYLLNTVDEYNSDELLKRKIYLKILQSKLSKLKQSQSKSQELLVAINEYEEKLKNVRVNEETLYQLIVDLENKKKNLGQSYITKLDNKNGLEEKLELAVARIRVKKKTIKKVSRSNVKIKMKFSNPISSYISRKGSSKGVTYKYNKVTPIKSSKSGQVVYSGELASYGKVIMIDHGKDVRSVILGDINIKVKKGDLIDKSGVIGYANVDPGLTKSLYYEIRKKNKAQNTLKLLKKI